MKAATALNAGLAHAHNAVDRPWLPYVARTGYAARGIVYLLVGKLAIFSAIGRGSGGEGGQNDALHSLLSAPAGVFLLFFMAIGLVCFAVWRLIQAILNVDHHDHDPKGFFARFGILISAATHAALALAAVSMAWGARGGGEDGSRSWTAWLMSQPAGRWLVAAVGVGIFAAGVAHVIKAVKRKYEKRFDLDTKTMERLRPLFMFGLIARGFVFGVIAIFFLYAAWTYDPNQAGGLGDVFDTVRSRPYGGVLMGILAAGLFAFGVYGLAQARYRRIQT